MIVSGIKLSSLHLYLQFHYHFTGTFTKTMMCSEL